MRIAIVTGATSGVGYTFLKFWQEKQELLDEVWLIARHDERLIEVAAQLPWKCRLFAIDLSIDKERRQLLEALHTIRPQVKYVVNSAGYGKIGRVGEISQVEQLGMVTLNCTALLDICQNVLPFLQRGSVVYNIASVAAFMPQPSFAVYAATKSFVLSFSRAFAVENKKKGIRVIAVCPNPMATQFFERAGYVPKSFKQLGFEKVEAVVAKAIENAEKGKDISINCWSAKGLYALSKLVPQRVLMGVQQLFIR